MVGDELLEAIGRVTVGDAWRVLDAHGYHHNFAGGWTVLHADQVLVGRALTCRWIPLRPDLHELVMAAGERDGRIGFPNSWVIDEVVDGDVIVADLFAQVNLVGDNLTTAIKARGGRGMVIEGGLRDLQRIVDIPDFGTFVKRIHPEAIPGVTMPAFNDVTRIGEATCLPGDVVVGSVEGVVFVPPHLAQEVGEVGKAGVGSGE